MQPPIALMSLGPTDQQEVLQEVATEFAERYEADLTEVLERGALTFGLTDGPARLAQYRAQTLPDDIPLILDPEYLKLRGEGMAPPLAAEQLVAEYQAAVAEYGQIRQEAAQSGQQAPNLTLPPAPPSFWPSLLPPRWPPLVFKWFQRDYIELARREAGR